MPISPSQALNMLQNQPETFLRKYPVRIFGDPTGSHVAHYRLEDGGASQRPGSRLGTLRMHATQLFEIRSRGAAFGNPAGSVWFQAHSVKMFSSSDPNAIGTYTLPAAGGPDLMVTGQLSGCAFAIHDNGGGSFVVAHIRPHDASGNTAEVLHGTLRNTGYWNIVYGRGDYSRDRRASIIGVRRAGQWHIYAQKQDGTTGDYSVRKVKQLV